MSEQNLVKECSFHGIYYIITVDAQDDILSIELEQKYDTSFWRNTFSSAYIEDLTQKTGSRKSFQEFVKILMNSIRSPNLAHLTLDILTYQDLENMKNEKKGQIPNNSSQNSNIIRINKRYVILTQLNEKDKFHYPLSLNLEDNVDIDKLKKTFTNIKSQLDNFRITKDQFLEKSLNSNFFAADNKSRSGQPQTPTNEKKFQSTNSSIQSLQQNLTFEQLKSENEMLRSRVQRIELQNQISNNLSISSQQKGAIEMDQIIKDKFQCEEDYEQARKVFQAEYERLNNTFKQRESELEKRKQELAELRNEMSYSWQGEEAAKRIRACILKISDESEKEIQIQKRQIAQQQKELDRLNQEYDSMKQIDKKQKNRVRQLELDLENAQKKVVNKGVSDRLYSPSNKQSPTVAGRRANSVPTKSYSPASRTMPSKLNQGYNQNANSTLQNQARQTPPGQKSRMNPSYNYNFKRTNENTTNSASSTGVRNYSPNTRSNPQVTNKTTNYSPSTRNTGIQQTKQSSYSRPSNQSPSYQKLTNPTQSPGYQRQTNPNQSSGYQRQTNTTQTPSYQRNTNTNQSPGQRNPNQNPSPGTRYSNYITQNSKTSIQNKIDQQKKLINNKNIPREFSDKHISKPSQDLDNRLNKLENLLNQAKK